jgi:hypothetical protein
LANLETSKGPFPFIIDTFRFHRYSPRAQRITLLRKYFRIDHLLPNDYGDDTERCIDVMVDFLGIIALVQDNIGKFKGRISGSQSLDQWDDEILIRLTGGRYNVTKGPR